MTKQYQGHRDQHFGHISYSQHGEDLMLLNLFRRLGIDKPSYLDLGANHPTMISNTALLYAKGSKGVNIEPNINLLAPFLKDRPKDVSVCIGVGLENGSMPFYMFDSLSGRNTTCLEEAERYSKESERSFKKCSIAVNTLETILELYCDNRYPDFLNCDLEGLDYAILENAKFTADNHPKIICVEVRLPESRKMTELMYSKGYSPHCRMGENIIYVDDASKEILNRNLGRIF